MNAGTMIFFIYPLHLGGDKYFIEVFKKGIRKVDEVQRNLEKTKIKILEYYCFFHGRLKIKYLYLNK